MGQIKGPITLLAFLDLSFSKIFCDCALVAEAMLDDVERIYERESCPGSNGVMSPHYSISVAFAAVGDIYD